MKNPNTKFLFLFLTLSLNSSILTENQLPTKKNDLNIIEKIKTIIGKIKSKIRFGKNYKQNKSFQNINLEDEYEKTYATYLENPNDYETCKKLVNLIVSLSEIKKENYTSFDSVIGLNESKNELKILIDFLKNPEKYKGLNLKIEKGILFVGQKGNGKTHLAKSIAGQTNVPFFYISALDIIEKWPNLISLIIKELNFKARQSVPSILFIDDLDSLKQGNPANLGLFLSTITELTNNNVIIISATREKETFDESFFRAGRFEKVIYLDYPDLSERENILKLYTNNLLLDGSLDLKKIAMHIYGLTREQIVKLVNDVIINGINNSRDTITNDDFNLVIENMLYGQKWETISQTEQQRKIIAYHESGHALIQVLLCKTLFPIQRISIAPRKNGTLGLTSWSEGLEAIQQTKDDILSEIQICLGGKAAEELVFGNSTNGAYSDLRQATNMTKFMIGYMGMSEKLGLAVNDPWNKNYSEKTAELIDLETKDILDSCYKKTINLLFENREKLDTLAKALLEKETLYASEIYDILGI